MLDFLIIIGAKYLLVVPIAALAGYFVWALPQERWRFGLLALVALPLAYALARVVGLFYNHPQPFVEWGGEPLIPHAIDNAFPSDHTLLSGSIAAVIGLFSRNYFLAGALFAVTGVIGLSRVAAGLHNLLDIGAALALGCIAVWISDRVLNWLRSKQTVSPPLP